MQTALSSTPAASTLGASEWFDAVQAGLAAGTLAPYLGPGVSAAYAPASVPTSYEALASFFSKRVALPRRARGNAWASAQYVESQRHHSSVTKLMSEAFATPVEPGPLHRRLAGLRVPLIVDTWYDGALRGALTGRSDWAELQGISRAPIGEARWFRAYGPDGGALTLAQASEATTVLYKPHGSVVPKADFLISDADYVEVLTEIDIQSPIPDLIKARRAQLGFVFLGCRFHDQMLRTYARQILKRSRGPHYALLDPAVASTRNEARVLAELGVSTLVYPRDEAFARLCA